MIMIRVRVFGSFRDKLGRPYIDINADNIELEELLKKVRFKDSSTLFDYISMGKDIKNPYRVFVNGSIIDSEDGLKTVIKDGDEVVVTPPISAGGGMVDITGKKLVFREAVAEGIISLKDSTIKLIKLSRVEKGDVMEAAKISAINAVKNTSNLLPYCHPINITHVGFEYRIVNNNITVRVKVSAYERTGVEMEALTGVVTALLTIWDMVKKYEKDESGNYPTTRIKEIKVLYKKKGG